MDADPVSVFSTHRETDNGVTVVITGNDLDSVWSTALDVKNGFGLWRVPELRGPEPSIAPGWWFCALVLREPPAHRPRAENGRLPVS